MRFINVDRDPDDCMLVFADVTAAINKTRPCRSNLTPLSLAISMMALQLGSKQGEDTVNVSNL